MVAVPEVPVESEEQYQTDAVEFHLSICVSEHPPRSLRPEPVTSRPELFDVTEVVPVVSVSRVIESAASEIPLPAPIFIVVAPGPVPPVRPDPAVMAVSALLRLVPMCKDAGPIYTSRHLNALEPISYVSSAEGRMFPAT